MNPQIVLSPVSGPVGTLVTVTYQGFPDGTYDFQVFGPGTTGALQIMVVSGVGSTTFTVPNDPPGITVKDLSGLAGDVYFQIL